MRRRVPGAGVLAAALLAGCALSGCAPSGHGAGAGGGSAGSSTRGEAGQGAAERTRARNGRERAAGPARPAYRRWGLAAPLAARPEEPDRPAAGAGAGAGARPGLPPVVDHVPTGDPVVFLAFDDGAERDPHFVDLVRELRLPVTMFLTDSVAGPGYGHFARLRGVGAGLQNHTLDHRSLRGLPYAGQRAEICGQQEKLRSRFGVRPSLLRPPYGTYDTTTLHAAAGCGVSAVVLGRAPARADGPRHAGGGGRGGDRLRPGDIVIVTAGSRAPGARGGASLTETTARLLRRIQERGLTVGRLEDYL